jgi:precorrin-6B methylase 2
MSYSNDTNQQKIRIIPFVDLRRKLICYRFIFKELLASKINFFYKQLMNYRNKVISDELGIITFRLDYLILFIGAGLIPSTPIKVAQEVKVKRIIAIDNNLNIVRFASTYIDENGLADIIKIEIGDGISYPVEDYDIIFLAADIWPLEEILVHLSQKMKKGAQLICRDIKNDIKSILKQEQIDHNFYQKGMSIHPLGPNFKSILLIKK